MKLLPLLSSNIQWSRRLHRYFVLGIIVLVVPQFLDGLIPTTTSTGFQSRILPAAHAWEWMDYIVGGSKDVNGRRDTLSHSEISDLRVRDLKRRLARSHGYGADELARMLDKKDLIAALNKEETKRRTKYRNEQGRKLFWKALFVTIMCIVAVAGWPLWVQLSEVTAVNWQVYYDRKRHEISQCIELRSGKGVIGVTLLAIVDGLRFWLSLTVLLSWVLSSNSPYKRYLFPIPSLPIRPGQFMGEKVANGPLGRYGMNIAPMAITWCISIVRGKLEYWTGKALSAAARLRRKDARSMESEEERKARKAAKRAAKRAKREEQERRQQEAWSKEAERRKEMAQKASEQLFGAANSGKHTEEIPEKDTDESTSPDHIFNDAKLEFEASIEGFDDMNDLD